MIPTRDAPKSLEDLKKLLAGDNKVKVAGKSLGSLQSQQRLINATIGIDG
jgi:hypothetical protein